MKRLCIFCKYLDWDDGFFGSESTPAEDWGISCKKNHWQAIYAPTRWHFINTIIKAKFCKDYEEIKI